MTTQLQGVHSGYLETRMFGSLDGLRAFAILAVVWHHTAMDYTTVNIAARGFLGVDLFFIISGFLIATLLLREQRLCGSVSLRSFYLRRVLRIAPPYYLMLCVVGAMAFLNPGGHSSAGIKLDLPYAILFLSNLVAMQSLLSITWSLAVEEQFYLIVPALEKHVRRWMRWILPLAYVIAVLPSFGLFPGLALPHFFRETTFGPILLGVMLAHSLDNPRGFAWLFRALGWRFAPVVALVLLLTAVAWPVADISGLPRLSMSWAMLVLLATCVVREDHAMRPILTLWPMRRIGAASYGIYLYHLLVAYFVDMALARFGVSSNLTKFVVVALTSWPLAECSFWYYESRFLALKARFAQSPALGRWPVQSAPGASA